MPHSELVFQVVMKVFLSREEKRTYFISHFVSLIYNLQIFRHMVCEPPSVLLLGPTNPCHLLPTLNTKCLLSPSSELSPGTPEWRAPSQHPNITVRVGSNRRPLKQ